MPFLRGGGFSGKPDQGHYVEIGGDTTKLQTALKGVNTEIRNTQSQLRDVEKLLKLDPGNTELLAQRHRLLGQAVSETKEKLETLKTAAEQANTALANGEISQEQYDALQRCRKLRLRGRNCRRWGTTFLPWERSSSRLRGLSWGLGRQR